MLNFVTNERVLVTEFYAVSRRRVRYRFGY